MTQDFGVNEIAQRIHKRLQRYIEAQYHIKDTSIIEERKCLLEEPGTISQLTYIEVTPSYAAGTEFSNLQIPPVIANILDELSKFSPSIGVFPPYKHQSDALENFFSVENPKDLIVATGTGSGKTETFLYTIMGMLASEGSERPNSFKKDGVRALLLYPMNALVSDQTSRLRRLFGNERLANLFRERWGKHPRFGMYTSRTPYPGLRTDAKNSKNLAPLLKYYVDLEVSTDPEKKILVEELKSRGRFPAKDVQSFFNERIAEEKVYQSGKKAGQTFTKHNWGERFKTNSNDRELLTRHEIQEHAPDLLVTNYSMLEYMMLRPIEAPIFDQTKEWLEEDERNQFLLILDEAHMYRGVGGAEVGFLIRRLMSRLGINRDRLRCILTSASLGDSEQAQLKGIEFADGLTGKSSKRTFAVVRGTREERSGADKGKEFEVAGLKLVHEEELASAEIDPASAFENLKEIASKLNWIAPPNLNDADKNLIQIRQYVGKNLSGFGPLELLIEKCSGNAMSFDELSKDLFPNISQDEAEKATNGLLALGTFARRSEPKREEQPLLPTRVHMLYRGLPTIFACINSKCDFRRDKSKNNLLGRLYIEPRTQCECGSRVYELYTHRDCGTAFLRVFGIESRPDFFWHESGGKFSSLGNPLHEFHILLEDPPYKQYQSVIPIWIETKTGKVFNHLPDNLKDTKMCYLPVDRLDKEENLTTFKSCPICLKATSNQRGLKIMDLATKGEQPFANLIREQFVNQVPTKQFNSTHPNGGRKSLLFSDGRQKAARLARDLPREVERDSFREALVLSIKKLNNIKKDATLDNNLYAAFIAVCSEFNLHFFDKSDQDQLITECVNFRKDYREDEFEYFLEESSTSPTISYRKALLKQISDPYYSLLSACAAHVEPKESQLKRFKSRLGEIAAPEIIDLLTSSWIQKMLSYSAYDPAIPYNTRKQEFQYFQPIRSDSGMKTFFKSLGAELGIDQATLDQCKDNLFEFFTANADGESDSGKLLNPRLLQIRLTLEDTWWQCEVCGNLQLKNIVGKCNNCGEKQLEEINPNHPYMTARKGFFREPLIAVLNGERPVHITAEEHTAQLSQRDSDKVYATTEEFELRFQDVPIDEKKPPVDVLSCTTTMEVGIDIGSLTAVGLRNVPPQRENYQQRAGRAGRRGTSISSVITFAQGGAHDAYYFENPGEMISGPPREPRIKIDNPRLAKRHINSYLLQTFFYETLESLSEEEREDAIKTRPNLMSAYGDAHKFFENTGLFTFETLQYWIKENFVNSKSSKMEEVADWLPNELFGQDSSKIKKREFIKEVIDELIKSLNELQTQFSPDTNSDSEQLSNDDNENQFLLNVMFDRGLLPSYAFPTDLCSFYILTKKDGMIQIKEQPQMAKSQALSEYAPGRLLVINKETYRVGGLLFYPITTSKPAEKFFRKKLTKYIGCDQCTYMRLDYNNSGNTDEGKCSVCGGKLSSHEMIDPPDFAPDDSRGLSERDRDQDITYATSAELPEVTDREDFKWNDTPNRNFQHTMKEDVKLIIVNKGKDSNGFDFCELCGAGWVSDPNSDNNGDHQRPFLMPNFVYMNELPTPKCNGNIKENIFLEHQFLTDIFLLRIPINSPFDFSPDKPWLRDALTTFAEAFTLGASLYLDIDPGELGAGFRMSASTGEENGNLEVFLYDTTSGGAGYAYEAGESLGPILERTKLLLSNCSNDECETSCTKCLRHYGNRFLHTRLNRKLGLQLLEYAVNEKVPQIDSIDQQKQTLNPLSRFLELEGWTVELEMQQNSIEVPLSAISEFGRKISVGIYPALLEKDEALRVCNYINRSEGDKYLLPDYLVENDLPSAYQTLIDISSSLSKSSFTSKTTRSIEVDIPIIQMKDLISGKDFSSNYRKVSIPEASKNCFGVIADESADLSSLNINAGNLIVLQEKDEDKFDKNETYLIHRNNGIFKATDQPYTVASLKSLEINAEELIQVSYSKPESKFRPERLKKDSVKILGQFVKVIKD